MDTDEKHEGGIPGFMGRVSRPGGPSLCLSPLATNAPPLDHVRRAAGGKERKQLFVCGGNPDSSGFPLATLLPNFYLADKVTEIINGGEVKPRERRSPVDEH